MTHTFSVDVPESGFRMKYYYQDSDEEYESRIFPPHVGDTVEFYILLEGDVSFHVENHLYRLRPGDILITKPNELHNCILNTRSRHRHFCFWFSPECDFLMHDFLSHPFGEENLISPPDAERVKISEICHTLYRHSLEQSDPIGEYGAAVELIHLVHENLACRREEEALPSLLRDILIDMEKNLPVIRSVAWFEEKYFVSRSTLGRIFRKYLNVSPMTYLETKRLALARVLLKEGKSVTEAAACCGFADYSNFIRLFRKRFGITPNRYRKQ